MRFAHFFIDRPIFASVLSIVLLLVGSIAYTQLPVAQYPEIAPPTIVVRTSYPGADAETIANTVATPIEQQINGVEDMLYMSSYSTADGSMSLTITFKLFTPAALPAMRAARQQQGGLDFTVINRLHVPVAIASMLLLVATLWLALTRPRFADLAPLAATVALAILANAAVCGVLANPHDRYGARMVWLATFVVLLVLRYPMINPIRQTATR